MVEVAERRANSNVLRPLGSLKGSVNNASKTSARPTFPLTDSRELMLIIPSFNYVIEFDRATR
jgi:hypothetical protein